MPDVKCSATSCTRCRIRGGHARILIECQLIGGISDEILRLRILEYAAHTSHSFPTGAKSAWIPHVIWMPLQIAGIETGSIRPLNRRVYVVLPRSRFIHKMAISPCSMAQLMSFSASTPQQLHQHDMRMSTVASMRYPIDITSDTTMLLQYPAAEEPCR